MIVSASRRTDIPAFYSDWFLKRIEAGYCTVVNPFNRDQVSYVSLNPPDVDVIAFWTKNAHPLREKLTLLDDRGYRYFFQYTLVKYDRSIETRVPNFDALLQEFLLTAETLGPERIIWRYDPIIIGTEYAFSRHIDTFQEIAQHLKGNTRRVVISIVDYYKKTLANLVHQNSDKMSFDQNPESSPSFEQFIKDLVSIAHENSMEIQSCSETIDLVPFDIAKGKCIDDSYIKDVFGIDVTRRKDPGQRKECGCVRSIDIGAYDTCLHGCQYCYATRNHDSAKKNFEQHDPASPSLLGWHDANPPIKTTKKSGNSDQLSFSGM